MKYVIITNTGYWGKARTLLKAAQNAHINSRPCDANVYRFDPTLIEALEVTDMGGIRWQFTDLVMGLPDEVRQAPQQAIKLGQFTVKMTKGQLSLTTIPEE